MYLGLLATIVAWPFYIFPHDLVWTLIYLSFAGVSIVGMAVFEWWTWKAKWLPQPPVEGFSDEKSYYRWSAKWSEIYWGRFLRSRLVEAWIWIMVAAILLILPSWQVFRTSWSMSTIYEEFR